MMGGRRNVHAYNQDEIDRLQGIPLPMKIKCGRCHKNLPQVKYSTKQLTDARYQIKTSSKITKSINCHSCTGQQKVEIECTMCGKTKGLEEFAKSQRAKPDTAKCFKCVELQLADEAVDGDRYEDPTRSFVPPDHSQGQFPEYWSAATSETSSTYGDDEWKTVNGINRRTERKDIEDGGIALSAGFQKSMSVNGSADESLIETEYSFPAGHGNANTDSWSEVRTKSWHTQSNAAPSASSGFNPNAYRRSTSSVTGSSHTFGSSVAERSDTSEIRPNGWAKIRAAPRGPPMMPMGDTVRQTGSTVDAWDSDEEEDEEDEDDDDSDDDTVI